MARNLQRLRYPANIVMRNENLRSLQNAHIEMLAHVLAIRHLADITGEASHEEIVLGLDQTSDFLARHVAPLAMAEEEVLYPEVARLVGAAAATRTMSRDHVEIARLADELDALRSRVLQSNQLTPLDKRAMRRVLYGLDGIIRLHVAKEEEIYLPLLEDHLNQQEQAALTRRIERAVAMALHPSRSAAQVSAPQIATVISLRTDNRSPG